VIDPSSRQTAIPGWDHRRTIRRRWLGSFAIVACSTLGVVSAATAAGPASAQTPPSSGPGLSAVAAVAIAQGSALVSGAKASHTSNRSLPHTNPTCTFNGGLGGVFGVTPGSSIAIVCSGWPANDSIGAAQFSPLLFSPSGSTNDIDQAVQSFHADGAGNLSANFVVPNPFSAPDPAAVCPPTPAQAIQADAQTYLQYCGFALADTAQNGALCLLNYVLPAPPAGSAGAVGMATPPNGVGYWVAWSNGDVTIHGFAVNYGNASQLKLTRPISHIVATPDGMGYWLVASDGGTFAFGDAKFFGSMGGRPLNAPVVAMAPTSSGMGYWLVGSDGGIFSFGDANFQGSMGGVPLNKPVVGITADRITGGYWEVGSDGGIFSFGAPYLGSTGSLVLNKPVNGMAATATSNGYLLVASDGGIFNFGDGVFHGSTGNLVLNSPIVGMSIDPATGGYWLLGSDGGIFSFNAPFFGAA
jgi:hypothetical protein